MYEQPPGTGLLITCVILTGAVLPGPDILQWADPSLANWSGETELSLN